MFAVIHEDWSFISFFGKERDDLMRTIILKLFNLIKQIELVCKLKFRNGEKFW